MTDVFISYSRKDKDFVRKLHTALEESGRDAWIDWENIPLTADWLEEIKSGIEEADSFIYVISPDSVHSDVCAAELGHALESNKRLVPVMHRELVEDYDQAALHPAISSHNWLFFRDEDDFEAVFKVLTDALDSDLDHMRTHTRLLVKAREWNTHRRDESMLLRGQELRDAEDWLANSREKEPQPTPLHTEYIMASHNISNARQRTTLLLTFFALVVAVGLALLSLGFWFTAQQQATRSQSLALASIARNVNDRVLAVSLVLDAASINNPPEQVVRALADVIYAPGVRFVYEDAESSASMTAIAQRPDSLQFATAEDTVVYLWTPETREIVASYGVAANEDPTVGHTATVNQVVFNDDGSLLVSASDDGRVLIWEVETGEILHELTVGIAVNDVVYGGNVDTLVLGLQSGEAVVWNIPQNVPLLVADLTRLPEPVLEEGQTAVVTSIAYHPGQEILAAGYASGRILIWDVRADEPIVEEKSHEDAVNDLLFSPDGRYVYTASSDERTLKISALTGRMVDLYAGHTNEVNDIAISADGNYLLTVSRDRTVIYWEEENAQQLTRLWGHTNWVNAVTFSPDGRRALSASQDGTAIEWDLRDGNIVQVFRGHSDWVRAVDISSDDALAVSGSDDDTLRIWDLQAGRILLPPLTGHEADVRGVHFSSDNTRVVSVSLDGTARIWDVETGELLATYEPHAGEGMQAVDIHGDVVLTGADDGSVHLWNIETGELIQQMQAHDGAVQDVRFSADGTQILSAATDNRVIHQNLATGESQTFEMRASSREALSVDFTPDGNFAAAGSRGAEVYYWDLRTGEQQFRAEQHGSSVRGLGISPVLEHPFTAFSASADLTLLFWNLDTGRVLRQYDGHERTVYDVVFSADGTRILSASRDTTLIYWRVDDLDSLREWQVENRFSRELTENECEVYGAFCN